MPRKKRGRSKAPYVIGVALVFLFAVAVILVSMPPLTVPVAPDTGAAEDPTPQLHHPPYEEPDTPTGNLTPVETPDEPPATGSGGVTAPSDTDISGGSEPSQTPETPDEPPEENVTAPPPPVSQGGPVPQYASTPVFACGTISSDSYLAGPVMYMPPDGSYCFQITADDITLDCKHNTITGDTAPNVYAIYASGRDNIRVVNCTVTNFDYGIYLTNTNNSLIANSSVIVNFEDGINVIDGYNVIVENNTVSSNGADGISGGGIEFHGTNFSFMTNNTANGNNDDGIYLDDSINNTLRNNTVRNNSANGIHLYHSHNNTIGTHVEGAVTGTITSLYVQASDDNLFSDVDIIGSNYVASMEASGGVTSNNNVLEYITVTGAGNGLIIYGGSDGNILRYSQFTNIGGYGVRIYNSACDDNLIYDNTFNTIGGIAVSIEDTGSDNYIYRNTFTSVTGNHITSVASNYANYNSEGNSYSDRDSCLSSLHHDNDGDTYPDVQDGDTYESAEGCKISGISDNYYVVAANNAPTASGITDPSMLEDATDDIVLTADFGFTDTDGDSLSLVKITNLEDNGDLELSDVDVTLNQEITKANLDSGLFTFTPVGDASGEDYDTIQFQLQDNRGVWSILSNYDMNFDVTAQNDAPVMAPDTPDMTGITEDQTGSSGDTVATILGSTVSDVDAGAVEGVAIYSLASSNGAWEYNIGAGWVSVGSVDLSNALLIGSDDSMRFVPDQLNADTATFSYYAWDKTSGSEGTKVDVNTRGTTTPYSSTGDVASIAVSAVNDAPTLTADTPDLTGITEDETDSVGDLISSILGSTVSDVDNGAVEGFVIYSQTPSDGTWQYKIDAGSWTAIGTVNTGSALLVKATDRVRFVPDGIDSDSASFIYYAWDQDSGTAGTKVDVTTRGTTTPYSSVGDTGSITVSAVNDAPVMAADTPDFTGHTEDETDSAGNLVSFILGSTVSDVDPAPVEGVAVYSIASSNGVWEYKTDGGWVSVGSVSDTTALLLRATDYLRFVPDGNNADTATVTYYAWDQTSDSYGTKVNVQTRGTTTAFSSVGDVASIAISAVNDAPVLTADTPTLTSITEDQTTSSGDLVSAFVAASITDVDSGAAEGIAIYSTTNSNGDWEYNIGAGWISIGSVATNNALLLESADSVRFVPDTLNADTASFSFYAWDITIGSAGSKVDATTRGTTTTFSSASDVGDIVVTGLNDAPVLSANTPTLTSITEDQTGSSGDLVSSIVAATITDVDTGSVEGIAVYATDNSNGDWEYNIGAGWVSIDSVATNNALLLESADSVRFVPDTLNADTATFNFYAWDITIGSAGTKVDATTRGTTTVFSSASDVGDIVVTLVNDAPVLVADTPDFTGITEDETDSVGDLISSILGTTVSDVDAAAVEGVVIHTITSTYGTWQYKVDAGSWTAIGTVNTGSALLLKATDRVRFVPDGIHGESGTVVYYAWDQSTGTTGNKVDVTTRGTTTPYSSVGDTGSIIVSDVNGAPFLDTIATDSPSYNEGDTITVTPTGAAITDEENSNLDYYCCYAPACTPTSGTNVCTGGNWETQASPYGSVSCTFPAPAVIQQTSYTVRCRLYDSEDYSAPIDDASSITVNNVLVFGDSVYENSIVTSDLTGSGDDGLTAAAGGIEIDCGGKRISGTAGFAGIDLAGIDGVTLKNCIISGFSVGVDAINSDNTVINNMIIENNRGVGIDPNNTVIENCTFNNNTIGILMDDGHNNTIINNTFGNHTLAGILLNTTSTNNTMRNNTFMNNSVSINISDGSSNNTVYWNNFTSPWGLHVHCDAINNSFNYTVNGVPVGNWWSDATSIYMYDTDSDGYADTGPEYPYSPSNRGNVTGNVTDWAPFTSRTGAFCGNVWNSMNLTEDVLYTGNESCFIIKNNSKVTFDCMGYSIMGNHSNATEGILVSGQFSNGTFNLTIKNCNISGFENGITLMLVKGGTIANSTFWNNTFSGLHAGAYNTTFFNITSYNNTRGISFNNVHGNNITNCNFSNNDGAFTGATSVGLYMYNSYNNTIANVTADSNYDGIHLYISPYNTIRENNITNNSHIGLKLLSTCNHNYIFSNNISYNYYGIELNGSLNSTFYNNTIAFSTTGLHVDNFTNWTYFYWNSFANNTLTHAQARSSENFFTKVIDGRPRGNIWDDVGTLGIYDSDDDGYGDSGGQYPYSPSNSAHVMWNVTDSAPLTSKTTPSCGDTLGGYIVFRANVSSSGNCFTTILANSVINCSGFTVIGGGSGIGFNISDQNNITLVDCPITGFNVGVKMNNTNSNTLVDLNIYNNTINVHLDPDETVIENSTFTNAYIGVLIESSNNVTLKNNTFVNHTFAGIFANFSSNLTLWNNTITNSTNGIYLDRVNESNVSYNRINDSTHIGIGLNNTYNITFENNTIWNGTHGISANGSLECNFTMNVIHNTTWGLYLLGTNHSLVWNNTFFNNILAVNVSNSSINNTFYYNLFNDSVIAHADAVPDNHFNTTIGTNIVGNMWDDVPGLSIYDSDSDNFGESGPHYPYSATYGNVLGSVTDWGPMTSKPAPGSFCGTITGNVIMTGPLSTSGTCFTIGADNTVLNCDGYSITGDDSTGSGVFSSGKSNITVKNCGFYDFLFGINMDDTNDTTILNNTLVSNYGHGIYILNSEKQNLTNNYANNNRYRGINAVNTNYTFLFGNTVNGTTVLDEGILVTGSHCIVNDNTATHNYYEGFVITGTNNTVTNNRASGNRYYGFKIGGWNCIVDGNVANDSVYQGGVKIHNGYFCNVTNNIMHNNDEYGMHLDGGHNHTVRNNTVMTVLTEGCLWSTAPDTLITNNTFRNCSDDGLRIRDFNHNISYNRIYNTSRDGIYLENAGRRGNNTIEYNEIYDNMASGIFIEAMFNNVITYNRIHDNVGYGIYANNSHNTTITFNNFTNNDPYGINLNKANTTNISYNLFNESSFMAIDLLYAYRNTVSDNNITYNRNGFSVIGANNNITRNTVSHNRGSGSGMTLKRNTAGACIPEWYSGCFGDGDCCPGLTCDDGTCMSGGGPACFNIISDNSFINNTRGISLEFADNETIENNTFSLNDFAIFLNETADCNFTGNVIENNTWGIFSEDSNSSIFTNNTFWNNTVAVNLTLGSSGNRLYFNQFNASSDVHADSGSENSFNTTSGTVFKGNLWDDISNLEIYDTDSDGYGDSGSQYPYSSSNGGNITGSAADWGPLVDKTNTLPSISQIKLNATTLANYTNETLYCWIEANDTENTTLMSYWQWWLNGTLNLTGSTQVANGTLDLISVITSGNTSVDDEWNCSAIVFDGVGNSTYWSNATVTIMEFPNSAPNTTQVKLNGTTSNNYTTENLHCWASGEDARNTTLIANWQWWLNGTLNLTGSTQVTNATLSLVSVLGSANTTADDEWNCSIMVEDGDMNETDWNNATLIVQAVPDNSPNTVEIFVNSTSGTNYTTENLYCWAHGNDTENTTLVAHWQWWLNGTLNYTGQTSVTNCTLRLVSTISSANTSIDDEWNCSVIMDDGINNESVWNNATVTILSIANTVPDTTQVKFNSSAGNNYTTEDIACYAQGYDVEQASLTAHWMVFNGSTLLYSGETAVTNATLTRIVTVYSGNYTKGDSWKCSVLMSDSIGNETGWNNVSITIVNSPPVITTDLTTITKIAGQEFYYDYNVTDADGDVITWSDNTALFTIGSGNGVINDTSSESDVGVHSVTITASDGTGQDTNPFTYRVDSAITPTHIGNVTISLTINNTSNLVYVPGVGQRQVSQLSTVWGSPPHYYMTSHIGDSLKGIVFAYQTPGWLRFTKTGSDHTMTISMAKENSKAFIVFTKGDWRSIEDKIGLIEAGQFLNKLSPSFGYGLGLAYQMKSLLEYNDTFIMDGDQIFNPGMHNLIVEYVRDENGRPVINVRRI